MKTFVISLPEAKERQAHITTMMKKFDLPFEFFEAVDGRPLLVDDYPSYAKTHRRLCFGRDMTGGEIGVLLSHKSIYRKMLDDGIEIALVLEDDAELYPDAPDIIKAIEAGPQDFECIRFLGSKKVAGLQQYTKRPIKGQYMLNRLCTTPGGAHVYIITLRGAVKMLRKMHKNHLPIDTLMGHCWKTGLDAYIVQPGLARQEPNQPQYIGESRFDKTIALSGVTKAAYPFARAWHKITEGLMKRAYYYKNLIRDKYLREN